MNLQDGILGKLPKRARTRKGLSGGKVASVIARLSPTSTDYPQVGLELGQLTLPAVHVSFPRI